jgi:hypothetical protein
MKLLRSRSGKRSPTPQVSKKDAQLDEISGAASFHPDGTEASSPLAGLVCRRRLRFGSVAAPTLGCLLHDVARLVRKGFEQMARLRA